MEELSHSITEADLIGYKYFYQIKEKVKDLNINIDKTVYLEELKRYFKNENITDANIPDNIKINFTRDRLICYDFDSKAIYEQNP